MTVDFGKTVAAYEAFRRYKQCSYLMVDHCAHVAYYYHHLLTPPLGPERYKRALRFRDYAFACGLFRIRTQEND